MESGASETSSAMSWKDIESADDDDEEVIDIDNDIGGWKRFFQLPFEPMWSYALLILATFQIISAIYEAGFRTVGEESKDRFIQMDFTGLNHFINFLYLIDILLSIGCKNIHGLQISPIEIQRPTWVLVADFISILPIHYLLLKTKELTRATRNMFYTLHLLKCLKFLRILHFVHYHHNLVGSSKLILQVCEYYFCMGLAVMSGFIITYHTTCYNRKECLEGATAEDFLQYFYISLSKITGRGSAEYPSGTLWMLSLDLIGRLTFLAVTCTSVAFVVMALLTTLHHKYVFLTRLKMMHYDLKRYNVPKFIKDECIKFFDNYWKEQTGYDDNPRYFAVMPQALHEELYLDIFWPALKHSKLLRYMDIAFLRHISKLFESRFLLPGATIYSKQLPKSMMVYVVSGVIQILSEEDDETAIISLSSGTCIGESSLILNYKPKATVRCKTSCNIHVLETKRFNRVMKMFPEQLRRLRITFTERLEKAKNYSNMARLINNMQGGTDRIGYITIMWLKSTLHRLMASDATAWAKHQNQNIFLRDEFNEDRFANKFFTAENLDMLAISERLQLVTDTIFLKNSCPCILQPESIIVSIWAGVVVLLVIICAIVVPLYAFVLPKPPLWYNVFIYITTVFWLLDLYIQISTAVVRSDEILAQVKQLFLYKMSTLPFLGDLLATIPLELLSCILLPRLSDQHKTLLHLNRIIKIWKVEGAFEVFENKLNANVLVIRYFKNFVLFCYATYFCSCMLYATNCFDSICKTPILDGQVSTHLLWCVVAVVNIFSGANVGSRLSNNVVYYKLFALFTLFSTAFYIFVYGALAAERTLKRASKISLTESVNDIKMIMRLHGVIDKYHQRIDDYVQTQWEDNYGGKLLYSSSAFSNLPKTTYGIFKEAISRDLIKSVPFFKNLPESIVYDICCITKRTVLPPNEVVCYSGDICDTIHIIDEGYCEVVSGTQPAIFLGPRAQISVIEACLDVPIVNTITTVTHCRLVSINYKNLSSIFEVKYPPFRKELKHAIAKSRLASQMEILSQKTEFQSCIQGKQNKLNKSFRKFGYNLRLDSFEEYDYYVPFDRLDLFSFVQYFLMRSTILPEGKFLFKWEICRSICGILSAILFPINEFGTCTDCPWFFLLTFLDAMAWIDIYVRLHVCYYNEIGILVSHPLNTATHYLRHGFLLDLFSVFPVHIFLRSSKYRNKIVSILQLNRSLQMYRFIGIFNYMEGAALVVSSLISITKYFPILLVVCVGIGSLYTNLSCDFIKGNSTSPGNIFGEGVVCESDSWLQHSEFSKPIDLLRVQLYGIYLTTTMITTVGMTGFTLESNKIIPLAIVLTLMAFIISSHILSVSITHHTTGYSALLAYQDAMRAIRAFMNKYRVEDNLQNQLIAHFELKWIRKKGKDIHESMSKFNRSLREDILYEVYGKTLRKTLKSISENKAFIRSLVLEVSHDITIKGTYITKVNDIEDTLFIVYKGQVNVITSDGTKLVTLTPGGMFGNLTHRRMSRQTVETFAVGHVEILTIHSVRFHAILHTYPRLKEKYAQMIAINDDYVEGLGEISTDDDIVADFSEEIIGKYKTSFLFRKVFDPDTTFMKVWKFLILTVVCYFGLFCDLYQMAMTQYEYGFIAFQYFCDLLFAINFYITITTAYENEVGIRVRDLDLIRTRFKQQRIIYWFTIIGMIPLDVFTWFLPWKFFRLTHPALRINRQLRFVYVVNYFQEQKQKIAINLYVFRTVYIIVWTTFFLHFVTCVFITFGCLHTPNMHPDINCTEISRSQYKRLETYIRISYFTVSGFINSSQEFIFPQSLYLIVYCIIAMVALVLIRVTVIGQIYSTLQMGYRSLNVYSQLLERMISFMAREQVTFALRDRVYEYLKLLWKYQAGVLYPRLLEEAPTLLREAIVNSAFGHHIKNHYVFKLCDEDFNRQMISKITMRTYFRNDNIVYKGTVNKCMYFIHRGRVMVVDEDSEFQESGVGILQTGMSFGIAQGTHESMPHPYTFRADNTATLVLLCFKDWKYLLAFFPRSKELIQQRVATYGNMYGQEEEMF